MERSVSKYAEGSCLITMGDTKVLITASVEERVPSFLKGTGKGWLTAEYSMLPRSCRQRTPRDISKGHISGRSQEIQRLVGRSLRGVVDLTKFGERSIVVDCDVIQGDGGTRTASVTGAFVAVAEASQWMIKQGLLTEHPFSEPVAGISIGIVEDLELLDLAYEEDSGAEVDMNVIMTEGGKFIEVQGTAEGKPYDRDQLNSLLDLAQVGLRELFIIQRSTLADIL
jgi:ribonuclease PH